MVRHIMITMSKIDLFAALPRWSTTVSGDARAEGLQAATQRVLTTERCAIRSAERPSIARGYLATRCCGFQSKPAAEFNSP
jgi:hypothetical protein